MKAAKTENRTREIADLQGTVGGLGRQVAERANEERGTRKEERVKGNEREAEDPTSETRPEQAKGG